MSSKFRGGTSKYIYRVQRLDERQSRIIDSCANTCIPFDCKNQIQTLVLQNRKIIMRLGTFFRGARFLEDTTLERISTRKIQMSRKITPRGALIAQIGFFLIV